MTIKEYVISTLTDSIELCDAVQKNIDHISEVSKYDEFDLERLRISMKVLYTFVNSARNFAILIKEKEPD